MFKANCIALFLMVKGSEKSLRPVLISGGCIPSPVFFRGRIYSVSSVYYRVCKVPSKSNWPMKSLRCSVSRGTISPLIGSTASFGLFPSFWSSRTLRIESCKQSSTSKLNIALKCCVSEASGQLSESIPRSGGITSICGANASPR